MSIRIKYFRKSVLIIASLASVIGVSAQDGKKQTIDITSSFKPVLRNAAKLNFNSSTPPADTSRPRLQYQIPVQPVMPGLQPIALKPLAMEIDSNSSWVNSNYVKVGFGNLTTPYVKAGLSLGTQDTRFNVFADHISSRGKIDYQDYSRTGFSGHFFSHVGNNLEFHAKAGFNQDQYYQYGFDQSAHSFAKEDLRQRFTTTSGEAGLRNLSPTEFGLSFAPVLKINGFRDNKDNNEFNAILDAPLNKSVGDNMAIMLGLRADITRYQPAQLKSITNNLFSVPVSFIYSKPNLRLQAGAAPAWDQGKFTLLPDFMAEFPVADEKWIIQAGWISYFDKGNYKRFASLNPYLNAPDSLRNTRITEVFGGFKGVLFSKLSYNLKVGGVEFRNLPLFVNDKVSGKSFDILFEEKLRAFKFQAELGYTLGENVSVLAGLTLYNFGKQVYQPRPWGIIPTEFYTHVRWKIIKDLWFKTDLFMWEGAVYQKQDNSADRLPGAFDLNAGLEFRVMKNLMLWAQFNNITNSKYQRWSQYDVYGFNMLGGVTFTF
ncbi:hypothetical protein [Pollutibacter soli]|uniref:hypothetical protein n=1 Tax=Pollutibacter soli TaxID=3034157 RepID=UPI003013E598